MSSEAPDRHLGSAAGCRLARAATVTVETRADFTLSNYRRVAFDGYGVTIGSEAARRMTQARTAFVRLLESDRDVFIYQTTSGGGPLASVQIPPEEQVARARLRQLRPSLGDSFGESDLPERVVRGIVFARLADYVEGHAKSRPEIAALLDGPLPRLPLGGVTGSGEIVALAHVLSGVRSGSTTFQEGEFDSLSNGSPCSAALVADAALQARDRATVATAVFALSAQAFGARIDLPATRARLGDDAFAVSALDRLDSWLTTMPAASVAPRLPSSYRVVPSLLGQALRAAEQARAVAAGVLRSVKNNPAFVPAADGHAEDLVLHNGGYHDAAAGAALDALARAWANLCALADLQTTKLHDGALSGLPEMLAVSGQDAWSTTAMLGFVPIGFGERARLHATPTTLPVSEGGGYGGQDDVALQTFIAFDKQQTVARQLDAALAVLATAACQAFVVSDREPGLPLHELAQLVFAHVTFGDPEHPRRRGQQIEAVADALTAMILAGDPPRPSARLGSESEAVPG